MEFISIKRKFQVSGQWIFNPPMYVKVRKKNIKIITIKVSTEIGEEFPIQAYVVTCRLNLRRRPFLV